MENPKYMFRSEFNSEDQCEFYFDGVTAMSFVNIKHGDVTAESIP